VDKTGPFKDPKVGATMTWKKKKLEIGDEKYVGRTMDDRYVVRTMPADIMAKGYENLKSEAAREPRHCDLRAASATVTESLHQVDESAALCDSPPCII